MPMTGVWRSTGRINNLDINYMQTVVNNIRNRLAASKTVRAQDIQDIVWLYNTWIQHTHDYYDHEYEAYGNKTPRTYSTVVDTRYGASFYVEYYFEYNSYSNWVWNGNWVGYFQPGLTPPPGYSLGPLQTTIYGTSESGGSRRIYSITATYTTSTPYYGGSVGYSRSTAQLAGMDYFDYNAYFAAGNKLTSWVIQDLANLVNSIRSHYHWFDDTYVDRSP